MIELLQHRLAAYDPADARQEALALKEILQEVTLYALWRAGLFEVAAFQGGTSLRVLHGLRRFSEDLDFILKAPQLNFAWSSYFEVLIEVLAEFGIRCELIDRHQMDRAVRKATLKDESIARQLNLSFYRREPGRKLKIKLEIDTNPPLGSEFDYAYLDFPLDFELCAQDLPSNFALKIHALLCRPYLKGRDWFDFGWYVAKGVTPNVPHLQAAIDQYGPWQGQGLEIDHHWLNSVLRARIAAIDWSLATRDVAPFLAAPEQSSLKLWSERFFEAKITKMAQRFSATNHVRDNPLG